MNYRVIMPLGASLALSLEGCAVGALRHGGVALMSNDLDLGKCAIVLSTTVVSALGNGAADGLVGSGAGFASTGILVIVHVFGSFLLPFTALYIFNGEVFAPPRLL